MRLKIVAAFALLYNPPLWAMDHTFRTQSEVEAEPFNFPGLPHDVQRIIQMMALQNIPRYNFAKSCRNLSAYTLTSKSFHAFANKPANTKLLVVEMGRRIDGKNEVDMALGLKNMRGMQSKEVQNWVDLRKQQIPLEQELLHCAHIGTVELLIADGADINAPFDRHGTTVLIDAICKKRGISYLQKLVSLGANVNITDKEGRTPLHLEIMGGRSSCCIQELLKRGSNVNQKNRDGRTALLLAAASSGADNNAASIMQDLIKAGADVDIQDGAGRTPLLISIQKYNMLCARVLLTENANVNLQDKDGETALMKIFQLRLYTIFNEIAPVINLILEANCNLGLRNKMGKTALDIAEGTLSCIKNLNGNWGNMEACVRKIQRKMQEQAEARHE